MSAIKIQLVISVDEFMAHYQGVAKEVVAISMDGKKVRFPSRILQPFVTRQGINGTFEISFDTHNRFSKIVKLA